MYLSSADLLEHIRTHPPRHRELDQTSVAMMGGRTALCTPFCCFDDG
jgi:hypothetical protein